MKGLVFFIMQGILLLANSINLFGVNYCKPIYTKPNTGFCVNTVEIDTFYHYQYCTKNVYDTTHINAPVAVLYSGKSYPIHTDATSSRIAFWIDYNQDGDFDDVGEFIDSSKFKDSYKTNWNIPLNTPTSNYRMRFLSSFLVGITTKGACKTFTSGEMEDYLVSIRHWYHDDMRVTKLLTPDKFGCGDTNYHFSIQFQNMGKDTQKVIPFIMKVQPKKGAIVSIYDTLYKTIPPGKIDTFTFTKTYNNSTGAIYNLWAIVNLPNDSLRDDDTLFTTRAIYPYIPPPTLGNPLGCSGSLINYYAKPHSPYSLFWFDTDTGKKQIGYPDTLKNIYSTNNTRMFAALSDAPQYSMTPYDTTLAGTSRVFVITKPFWHTVYFTAYKDFILDTVTIYPTGSGWIHVNLGSLIKDSFFVNPSKPKSPIKLNLNYHIKPGTYALTDFYSRFDNPSDGLCFSDSASYYYSCPLLSILGYSPTGSSKGWGYGPFYNWKVTGVGCFSRRVSIKPTLYPTPNTQWQSTYTKPRELLFTPKDTTAGNAYLWHFGDGDSSTQKAPTHQFAKDSTYKITLQIVSGNGCIGQYDSMLKVVYTGLEELHANYKISLIPNPTIFTTTLEVNNLPQTPITITLTDILGRQLMQLSQTPNAEGKLIKEIDVSALPKGMYFIEVQNKEMRVVSKLVVR
ncbi:MAG: GEVED domain-containing protein [Bacteroidetes bacterium]|nr:GEVED domain-containing protein [Bacteroidota bacterium]